MSLSQSKGRRTLLKEVYGHKKELKVVDASCGTDDLPSSPSFFVVVTDKSTSVDPTLRTKNNFQSWNARRKLGRSLYAEKACNRSLGKAQIMFCPPIDQNIPYNCHLPYSHPSHNSPLPKKAVHSWMTKTLHVVKRTESLKKCSGVTLRRLAEADVKEFSANFALSRPGTWANETFSSSKRKVNANLRIRRIKRLEYQENDKPQESHVNDLITLNKDKLANTEIEEKMLEDDINVTLYSSSSKRHRLF